MAKESVTYDQAMNDLMNLAVIPVYPHLGVILGVGKSAAYKAAQCGEIESLKVGGRRKIVTASFRKKLGIEAA